MFAASNINYELSDRTRAISYGGIGVIHKPARESGLIDAIDKKLHLLKTYLPYHESDHLLNITYDGTWGYYPLLVSLANTGGQVPLLAGHPGDRRVVTLGHLGEGPSAGATHRRPFVFRLRCTHRSILQIR